MMKKENNYSGIKLLVSDEIEIENLMLLLN